MRERERWERMVDWYEREDAENRPQRAVLANEDGTYRLTTTLSNGREITHPILRY